MLVFGQVHFPTPTGQNVFHIPIDVHNEKWVGGEQGTSDRLNAITLARN